MKLLIKTLLTVSIVIFLHSCSKDTIVNHITSSETFTLSGTIENWIYGGNIKLKAEIIDSTWYNSLVLDSNIVSVNGAFTLKLKDAPDSWLYPITFYADTSYIINVTVNPPNTKSSYSTGLGLSNDSSQIGYIFRSNYATDTTNIPGRFFVYYLYLNQNVSITGSIIYHNDPYYDTTIYNFSGVRGWNKVVELHNSITEFTRTTTISATEPAGGKWFAGIFPSDALSNNSLRKSIFRLNKNCILCK